MALEFKRNNGLVNVVVDAPNTIPSVSEVTNPALNVVRLHGRNHGTWNLEPGTRNLEPEGDCRRSKSAAGKGRKYARFIQ